MTQLSSPAGGSPFVVPTLDSSPSFIPLALPIYVPSDPFSSSPVKQYRKFGWSSQTLWDTLAWDIHLSHGPDPRQVQVCFDVCSGKPGELGWILIPASVETERALTDIKPPVTVHISTGIRAPGFFQGHAGLKWQRNRRKALKDRLPAAPRWHMYMFLFLWIKKPFVSWIINSRWVLIVLNFFWFPVISPCPVSVKVLQRKQNQQHARHLCRHLS